MSPTRFPQAEELPAHKLRVERLARNLAPSEHDAEDLAQEVWVAALRARDRRIDHFGGWTRAVTTRLAGKLAVKGRRRRDWELNAARPEGLPSNLESIERRSLRDYLERRIDELNEPYSEVLRLRFLDELGTEEIAVQLGRTGGTVRSQIKRGLELLRTRINGDLDAERGLRGVGLLALLARRSTQALLIGAAAVATVATVATLAMVLWPKSDAPQGVRAATAERAVPGPREVAAPLVVNERSPSAVASPATPVQPTFRGRVVDPRGAPVDGAEVWSAEPGAEPVLAAHAGADGTFTLTGVDPTSWVGARLEGRFPSTEVRLDSLHTGALELVLPQAVPGKLIVEVVDPDGLAVSGASVGIVPGYSVVPFLGPDLEWRRRLRTGPRATDAAGLFEGHKLGGRVSYVHVQADGYPPVIAKTRRTLLLPERVVVTLPRPATLAGGVRRPDGTPASGALLTLQHESGLPPVQTHAGRDGSFRVEELTPGRTTLSVVGSGVASLIREIRVEEEEVLDLELMLSAEHSVSGIVVDDSGAMVRGRRVTLGTRATITDPEGRFVFGAVPPGLHTARLFDQSVSGLPVAWADCRAGELALRLVARPGTAGLGGHLLGAGGLTRLALRAPHFDDEDELELFLNPAGSYSFLRQELPAGAYELVVRDPAVGATVLGELVLEDGQTLELGELVVPVPGTLEVRIDASTGIGDRIPQLSLSSELLRLRSTRFEPDSRGGGVLSLERVPPGDYDFFLTTTGFVDLFDTLEIEAGEHVTREVLLRPGVRRDFAVLAPAELEEPPTFVLTGPDGTRRVYADADRRPDDREGLFLSLNLAPGHYTLAAEGAGLEGELAFTVDGPIPKPAQNPLRFELRAR